ncbi:MAG: AsmA-like C-terminal region-containing protein [Saprospiraceae bacterium]|nr:AsmA-like C-terminal region-containing protein [Saprospiraceae bacterium]
MKKWRSPKNCFKWLFRLFLVVLVFFSTIIVLVYWKQEHIVRQILIYSNEHYTGKIDLDGSHISPFVNFPYISIDLEGLRVYENKGQNEPPILALDDTYLGFDLWTIIKGDLQLKSIFLSNGYIKFIQHKDGNFNIFNALMPVDSATTEDETPFSLEIESIKLHNVDVHKFNESTKIDLDIYVNDAKAQLQINNTHTLIDIDSRFEMNLIKNEDTTFIKHKHFELTSKFDFDTEKQLIQFERSNIKLEMGEFNIEGFFDIANNQNLDIKVHGTKPNFDLLIAFAPEELIPTLESYENRGEVYFDATVKGSTLYGSIPKINVVFGCKKGFLQNNQTNKKIRGMEFSGYFRNGSEGGGLETMEFGLKDFNARPEAGRFYGDLEVKNFLSPDIDLKLRSQFDLEFLTAFFNLKGLSEISGSINLTMNFHDIIDLKNPEKSIERLNESYFTELEIRNLNFKSDGYYLPINDLNIIGHIEGHQAYIDTLSAHVGNSDLVVNGTISDLPAIIHHTDDSVWVELDIVSSLLDLNELTYNDSSGVSKINEQIRDFKLDLAFGSSARAFTESKNLPIGEFFIRDLHAQLKHYPHKFHDFKADFYIEEEDIRLIDFSGELDRSDFHFSGKLSHYDFWFNHVLNGDTELEFDLTSDHLHLEDLFVYKGENYVPEDYRHEDFQGLKFHGRTQLHFKEHLLHSIDLYIDQLNGKMQLHKCRFEKFNGRIHYENQHLTTEGLGGQIGRSDFKIDLYWHLGDSSHHQKENHYIHLVSKRLDLNQLLDWHMPKSEADNSPVDHDAGFSVFNLPFWDMQFKTEIGNLTYHQYKINALNASIRMTKDRYIHIDTCLMEIADAHFDITGYFNATDSNDIYFSPIVYAKNMDVDKFLIKFDNFGQDNLVSENLHGIIDCELSGKLHMHKDLTPMLEKSDFLIDLEAVNGRLENYEPVKYLADYFKDKNLQKIRFDTLRNTFKFGENILKIPVMTINSSLGFIELWGEQHLTESKKMNLFFKIPMKLITKAVFQKLFKKKQEDIDSEKEDAIVYQDKSKKTTYVTVNLQVDKDEYAVKLQRDKQRLNSERQKERQVRKAKRKERRKLLLEQNN